MFKFFVLALSVFSIKCAYAFFNQSWCSNVYYKGVTSSDIEAIVDRHNYWRDLVSQGKLPNQPRATNMQTMEWDEQLAAAALKIAEKCRFKHEKVNDNRFHVGQNLYITYSCETIAEPDWNQAVDAWGDEYKYYRYPFGMNPLTGHYTQIVWATTNKVGCAAIGYTKLFLPFIKNMLYVCNYGPGGNYLGQAPYET